MPLTVRMYTLGEIFQKAQEYAELNCDIAKVQGIEIGPGDDGRTHVTVRYQNAELDSGVEYSRVFMLHGP